MNGYGSRFIEATFGIPVSALHYWDKTNLLKPSIRPAAGRGSKRLYSFQDLVQIQTVARLRELGLSLQRIRKCVEFLNAQFPHLETPLAELTLVTDGETIFLLTDKMDEILDALRSQIVWSLPIAALIKSTRETVGSAITPRTIHVKIAENEFTVTVEQDPEDGAWIGLVKELPGCGSQGSSFEDVIEMVEDAIREYLIALGDAACDAQENATVAF